MAVTGILPDAVARLTKGQLAVIAHQGAVAFGDDPVPEPVREPDPQPRRPGMPPQGRRPAPPARRR